MKYRVYFGHIVPFHSAEFPSWKAAADFMKEELNTGGQINSVEKIDPKDKSPHTY